MGLVRIIFIAQVVLSGASRISVQKLQEKMGADADTADPSWCKDINAKRCSGIQKKQCPQTCANGGYVSEEDEDSDTGDDQPHLEIVRVTSETRPVELTRVMKTSVYKEMWPDNCLGQNAKKQLIDGLEVDGFACEMKRGGKVPSIIHPMWHLKHHMCCRGKCVEPMKCPDIKPKHFYEAARGVSTADSLKITEMETRSGATVKVNIKQAPAALTESTGVLATVEVRMLQADLEFEKRKAVLTEKGQQFIEELDEPLGALITMQMMVWPDIEGIKVLFCPHGSTTANTHNIDPAVGDLPHDRAEAIKDHLATAIANLDDDIAVLGDGIGHYAEEVEGFVGAREAHIIYKIFDGSFESPGCQKSDLYAFKMDAASL